jgi:sporulation integral membrane protein YlbJ
VKARSALFQGFVVLLLVILMIVFSEHGFRASQEGLKLFFDVVLPSLLPFFIVSDLLLAYGVVHFLGELFEPLMRPLFNVPGAGSFVLSMGLAAGYPMDAVITSKFRRQGMCTRAEGERMLAFSNTADPLFIFGAVAVGMFGMPSLGLTLAAAHYLGALLVGLTFRGWARHEDQGARGANIVTKQPIFQRAVVALLAARREDTRPLGIVLQDAIRDSVATLFLIMSFIVLFSVLIRVLDATGLMTLLLWPLRQLMPLAGLAPSLAHSLLQGALEIDIGTAAAAKAHAGLLQQAVVVSAIIAWSGLSVQAQVAAVLADTDIRMKPYVLARVLHAVYAAVLTLFILPLTEGGKLPALAHGTGALPPMDFGHFLSAGLVLAGVGALAPIAVGIVVTIVRELRIVRLRV